MTRRKFRRYPPNIINAAETIYDWLDKNGAREHTRSWDEVQKKTNIEENIFTLATYYLNMLGMIKGSPGGCSLLRSKKKSDFYIEEK